MSDSNKIHEIYCYRLGGGLKQGWSTSKTYQDDRKFISEERTKELIDTETKSLKTDIKNLKYHLSVLCASYEGYLEGIADSEGLDRIEEPASLTDAKLFLNSLEKK